MSADKSLVKIDAAPPVTNRTPSNALIIQDFATAAYGVEAGPANPFKNGSKRNVPTGHASEVVISEHTFRTAQQAFGKPAPGSLQRPAKRQKRGDASVVDGPGSYRGPWAHYEREEVVEYREVGVGDEDRPLASDEEEVEVYEDEEEDENENAVVRAQPQVPSKLAPLPGYAEDSTTKESTEFMGEKEKDYQGRTYMHVPQDLDVDLTKELGSFRNFVPKKQIHVWRDSRGHAKGLRAITALRWFPNSGHLLLSSGSDGKICIWDAYHERSLLRTVTGHNKSVSDTRFSPDGMEFLTASFDRQLKIFDTETGAVKGRLTNGKTANVVQYHPSEPHMVLSGHGNNTIVQWDTRTGEQVQTYDHHLGPINSLVFTDDGQRFVSSSDDKSIRAWEFGIPVPIKTIAEPHLFSVSRMALHPSGKALAAQSADNQILVYQAEGKYRQNRKKSFHGMSTSGYACDVEFSSDGQYLLSGSGSGEVFVFDWKTSKLTEKWTAANGPVTCLAWNPQCTSRVATAGIDGPDIKFWD